MLVRNSCLLVKRARVCSDVSYLELRVLSVVILSVEVSYLVKVDASVFVSVGISLCASNCSACVFGFCL